MADLDSRWQAFSGNDEELPTDLPAAEFKKILQALGQDKPKSEPVKPEKTAQSIIDEAKKSGKLTVDPSAKLFTEETKISSPSNEYNDLAKEIEDLKRQKEELEKELALSRKTSEEISRLALKEANHLLTKAKRNADMILRESMEYVNGLTTNIEDYKKEAIDFRSKVVKLSDEVLETIDSSDLFSLIREENTKTETDHNDNF